MAIAEEQFYIKAQLLERLVELVQDKFRIIGQTDDENKMFAKIHEVQKKAFQETAAMKDAKRRLKQRCEEDLRALEQEQPLLGFDTDVAVIFHPYDLSYRDRNDRELLERHGRLITRALGNIQPPEQRPRLSLPVPTPGNAPIPRIRIGFLSGFYSNHSKARAFEGLMLHLDRHQKIAAKAKARLYDWLD
jgi:predicted O-linked N-acetylglucosamine transferase (SPINDLY family)